MVSIHLSNIHFELRVVYYFLKFHYSHPVDVSVIKIKDFHKLVEGGRSSPAEAEGKMDPGGGSTIELLSNSKNLRAI